MQAGAAAKRAGGALRRLARLLLLAGLAQVAAATLPLGGAAGAADRDVELRFLPSSGGPDGYLVYVTDETSDFEHALDIGFVAADPDGIARTWIVLDTAASYRVAMTAYNEMGESARSNEIAIPAEVCDPAVCYDANPCTSDACDAAGCLNAPVPDGTACDDGSSRTVDDQCFGGVCEGLVAVCAGDGDCDDGNPCNGSESCDGGLACLAGAPLDCGAPTQCTDPVCDPALGCVGVPRDDGVACDDGRADTVDDVCIAGVCEGTIPPEAPPEDPPGDPLPALAVSDVVPGSVSPGEVTFEIRGEGFAEGATLRFENGAGPAPRIHWLQLVDSHTLLARTLVRAQGPKRARFWDVVVRLPDGRSARLVEALRVDP